MIGGGQGEEGGDDDDDDDDDNNCTNGRVRFVSSCLLYVPVDVIKERLQVGEGDDDDDDYNHHDDDDDGDDDDAAAAADDDHHDDDDGDDDDDAPFPQVQRRLLSGKEVSGPLPMYQGTTHAFRTIMATEGLRGVYRVRRRCSLNRRIWIVFSDDR
jgi:hypothetical protein